MRQLTGTLCRLKAGPQQHRAPPTPALTREDKLSAVLYVISVPTWAPEVGERIEAFRRAHEPARAAIVPAHVTLVFGARAFSQAELTAHVAEVARRTAPF